jgi:hypothetical protein
MNNEDITAERRLTREAVALAIYDVLMRLFDCKNVDELIDKIGTKKLRVTYDE